MRLTKTLPKAPSPRVTRGAIKPRPTSPYTRGEARKLHSPRVMLVLGTFALLVALALILDLSRFSRGFRKQPVPTDTAALVELVQKATKTYADPAGRFTLPLPEGWRLVTGADAAPYDVRLVGPLRMEWAVQVAEPRFVHPMVLKSDLRHIEENREVNTHMEDIQFRGQPAIRRTCRLRTSTLRMLDFLYGKRAYHLMFTLPPEQFEAFGPLMDALLKSFEPLPHLEEAPAP